MTSPPDTPEVGARPSRQLIEVDDELMQDIEELVRSKSDYLVLNIVQDLYPGDIAHILNRLDADEADYLFGLLPSDIAGEVLLDLDEGHRERLLHAMPQPRLTEIVDEMASDDAADIVGELPEERAEQVLETMDVEDSSAVEELLRYDENTAGGIMGKEVVAVGLKDTIKRAIREVRKFAKEHKNIYNVHVVDDQGLLVGTIPLQDLLIYAPNKRVDKIMNPDAVRVTTDVDQEEVARIFKKYDIVSLPVTDTAGKLLGRITVDDVVDVIEEEHQEDVARLVGSDTIELERRTPAQIAFLRLPWVLITLAIEFLAGVVVAQFDATLSRVILLASFMPIISAISGNTGLQSAAVIVRGLATGHVDLKRWWIPVRRQAESSVIIGGACGLVLGAIGSFWHGTWVFGFAVGMSMFISVNISGLIGTVVPMLSRSMGFDPAITTGPFETAFQDVLGITIFLSISTLLLRWLV